MDAAIALVRAGWLTAASYRTRTIFSLASLAAMVVPVYFIAGAVEPVVADAIATEADGYFGFLILGLIALYFTATAVTALPGILRSGMSSGTLEALLGTRTALPTLLAGLSGYSFAWTAVRSCVLLVAGVAFGIDVAWGRAVAGLLVVALIVLAYLPFGLLGAAMVLAFKTAGPLPRIVLVVSSLLGGAYFPTRVIPSWLQDVSAAVPLTYGARALRRVMLEGAPAGAVLRDVVVLAGFATVLGIVSAVIFARALRYAKRAGTLGQY